MSVARGHICGVPMRLFRVSFTGELGFEINVPADYGRAVWEALWQAGQRATASTAYGTETMHVLRAEKGYIIVGQDTDGTVTPDDAGLAWAIGKNKADFVGKRSLAAARHAAPRAPAARRPRHRRIRGVVLEEGAQVMAHPGSPVPTRPLGHVTSSYYSATLGRSIALATGRRRAGAPGADAVRRHSAAATSPCR